MADTAEKLEFQAEVRQVLDIVIHSLYTHKEIFLRELVSNASDALDKRRFEALTRPELAAEGDKYSVSVEADPAKRTLTVRDNGIGMNRQDLVSSLGTIARSGTQEFLRALQAAKGAAKPELIGQFGVGFYSAFMAADSVEVLTRKAGEAQAWLWRSDGKGSYTVEEAPEAAVGTAVTLSLKKREEGEPDYADEGELRRVIRKYSDFITFPIRLGGKGDPVNSMKAIWTKPAKDISSAEHEEFYRHLCHDWNPPLESIRFSAEGAALRYDALLYVPEKGSMEFLFPERRGGLRLYVKRVLIMEDCREFTPDYLRFVRGVVDCPDLPLNISRETMQRDRQVAMIRERVVRKALDALKAMKEDARERYLKFWAGFGRILKEGLHSDPENRERLAELVLFESSASEPGKLSDLKEYVGRMKEGQKEIYYLTAESRPAAEASPHLEALRSRGYEVVFFTDPIDELVVDQLHEYGGKPLRGAGRGDLGLEPSAEDKERREKGLEAYKDLFEYLKGKLEARVSEVRLSDRLTDSAVCLVAGEGTMSARLEKMLRQARQDLPASKWILELNPRHPVLERMRGMFAADPKDPRLEDYAVLLYGQAALAEGLPLPDPARYARLVAGLMAK